MTERIPPQAVDVEESVLGSMMIDPEAADIAITLLKKNDFYKPAHQMVFEILLKLNQTGKPLDMLSVETELKDQNLLDKVGGQGYLADLTRSVSSSANIDYHAQIITEKAIRRRLILECNKIIKQAYDTSTDTFDVVDQAQSSVFGVVENQTGTMSTMAEVIQLIAADVSKIQESGRPVGLRTGLDIDNILQGFQDGKLYIIGARPSMGKTALVMTIMRRLAKDGKNSGIISLETSRKSLGFRLTSQVCDLPTDKITSGKMNEMEFKKYVSACEELFELGIIIDDEAALTAQKIRSKCRLMVKRGVEIIFVDFLQLLSGEGDNRHQQIGNVTKVLKQISKELDIPVVALSQLSRKVENRNDKRPQLSDLRESGSIEEDADCIMFLYRPEYYGITETKTGSTKGIADVIIAKNKDGQTGIQRLNFIAEYMRFENLSYVQPLNQEHPPVPTVDDWDVDIPF
ncbi:MAG: replicative DNA helicase [Balneolaceae bacterium]